MTTARRRRRCCLVGAAIFSAWGHGRSSSSVAVVSAFGFGGLGQQSLSRSLRWVGAAGVRSEAPTPRPGAARIRSRTPSPPAADGEAALSLSATSRRRSAFVVEGGGAGPAAAASTTKDWRDLSIEVCARYGLCLLCVCEGAQFVYCTYCHCGCWWSTYIHCSRGVRRFVVCRTFAWPRRLVTPPSLGYAVSRQRGARTRPKS